MKARKQEDGEELFEEGYRLYKSEDKNSLQANPEMVKLFEKSAKKKNPKALFVLGYLLTSGYKDIERNPRKGNRILKKVFPELKSLSENKHDAKATEFLALYYDIPLLYFVHDGDKVASLRALAELYENEKGMKDDTLKESEYTDLSSSEEKKDGKADTTAYDELLAAINNLEKGEDKNLAEDILKIAHSAKAGNIRASLYLGKLYLDGKYVERDPGLARSYLLQAEEQGSVKARYLLGKEQIEGNFSSQDVIGGLNRLYYAAKAGLPEAQYYLGKVYYEGKLVRKDDDKAYLYFQAASTRGMNEADAYMRKIELARGDKLLISAAVKKE